MENAGIIDEESGEERYDEVDHVKSAHFESGVKGYNQSCVDPGHRNGVTRSDEASGSEEAEDGEILEDGEIDDEDEEGGVDQGETIQEDAEIAHGELEQQTNTHVVEKSDVEANQDQVDAQKEDSESEKEEEEASKEKRKKDKRRRKRQREKEKKKKIKDDSKRKRKRHDYVDYDNVEAEFDHQSKVRRHSPLRPYNSPYQSPDERGKRSPPGPYESPYRSPPGPYDSPPESPPGPYDSPPEDSDEDERYGDQNNIRKRPKKSMMGLLDDPFLDPNIAAAEKQGIYGRPRGGRNRRGKSQQPRKKPLLETPREARPLCKFYKEGKCAKGSQCPFNHDFKPPKKPDICKFYLNNTCNKGSDCIYMHGEYPCKFFHTGAECFGGEDCKFSHEPLTAETYQLLNKILDNDLEFDAPPKNPRPSLLGSPPRHVKEAAERMKGIDPSKKIPSLLDIEVFPPKQSPQKKQNSPNKEILSPKAGQAANRPGFYTETAPAQPGYNPAVAALGALLNKATASSSPRYYQSPGSQGGFGSGDCMTDGQADSHETEDSEVDPNSQDTQKLDDDESQDDGGLRGEEMPYEEDRKVTSFEVPSHLPPKQRELFMRIHNQQQAEGGLPDENKEDEVEKDDDDWYSSDEDDGQPKQKIMDMLKNISKQPPTARPPTQSVPEVKEQPKPTDSGSGASSFNILQMLNAIRGQSSAASITSPGSVSSASQLIGSLLPQSVKTSAKEIPLDNSQSLPAVEHSPPPVDDTPDPMLALLPKVPKDGSELPYKVLPITVSKTSYIPSNLNLNDPRVSSDPRVQRYISKVGPQKLERQSSGGSSQPKVERQNSRKSEKESVSVSSSAKVADPRRSSSTTVEVNAASKPADPRKARMAAASEGPSDPRRAQKDSTANSNEDPLKSNSDARLQRAMTELIQSAVNIPDPRLQKSQSNPVLGMHSMPVRPPMPPGFPPMGFPSGPPGGPMRPIGAGPPRPMGAGPPRPGMPRPRNVRPPLLQTPIMPDNSFRPRGPPPFMDPRFGRQNSNDLSYGSSSADPRSRPGMSPGHEHPAGFGQASGDPRDPRNRSAGVSPSHGQDPLASGTVDPRDPRNRSPGTSHSQEQLGNAAANDSRDPRMRSAGISPSHSQELPGPPAIDPRGDPRDPRNRQAGKSPSQDHSPGALLMDPRVRQVKSQDNLDPRIKSQGFNNSKKSDPRMDRQGGSLDSGLTGRSISDPRMSRQTSQPVMSSGDSRGDRSDDNVSPRLDPRSFRKTEVDTEKKSHSPRIRKRFIGERKGSMEYSSPLGLGSDQPDPAVTGFSTYNRLPGVRGGLKQRTNDQPVDSQPSSDPRSQKLSGYKNSPVYNSGYDSPQEQRENEDVEQIELTAGLQAPPLKELFKTIDPTASPFC